MLSISVVFQNGAISFFASWRGLDAASGDIRLFTGLTRQALRRATAHGIDDRHTLLAQEVEL
jgi:hypothetical protein